MARGEKDDEREHRIAMEAVVDAYGPEEQALGWYYYLEGQLHFPFDAICVRERSISPLRLNETVRVLSMARENDCQAEMFVTVEQVGRNFGVPLAQLQGLRVDRQTEQAIADWRYWVDMGYTLV